MRKNQRWAVESRFYDNGKTSVRVRQAFVGERKTYAELEDFDYYVDIFDSRKQAEEHAKETQKEDESKWSCNRV